MKRRDQLFGAAAPMTPGKPDRTGPWKTADYSRFCELCDYGHIDDEFRKNPVYQWLKKHVPCAVPDSAPYARMHIVAKYIIIMMQPAAFGGPGSVTADELAQARKWHTKVQEQIRQLQKTLGDDPRMLLPRLDEALAWALPLLNTRATKAAQPWLLRLACELYQQTGSADVELLLQVAEALTLECNLRTAQRYVEEAKERGDR